VRMVQAREDRYLAVKSRRCEAGSHLGPEDLDRHPALVLGVVREIDHRERSATDLPVYRVATGERLAKNNVAIGHVMHGVVRREWPGLSY
jgi:hypothetical protein